MIHTITFMYCGENVSTSTVFGEPALGAEKVNVFKEVKKVLKNTGDHLIWIVTTDQLPQFMSFCKKYELDKFFVVDQSSEGSGTTNRNYPDRGRRLRTFIMKGIK